MTTPRWVRAIIMVPSALRGQANAVAQGLDFDAGGALTFDVPLGPEGATEPTDFMASTLMRPHTAAQVEAELIPSFPGARYYAEAGGWTAQSALADAGLVILSGWEG